MTNGELIDLWEVAATIHYPNVGHSAAMRCLDTAIGGDHYKTWCHSDSSTDKPLPQEVVNLLRHLLGPNGKTILKMHQARKRITNGEMLQEVGESDQGVKA